MNLYVSRKDPFKVHIRDERGKGFVFFCGGGAQCKNPKRDYDPIKEEDEHQTICWKCRENYTKWKGQS